MPLSFFLSFISLPAEQPTAQLFPSLPEAAYTSLFPAPDSFISLQAAVQSPYLFIWMIFLY